MTKYKAIKVNGKKRDEHRHIMEIKIGRKLLFNEVVHHVDENKLNNEVANLQILNRSEHSKMHRLGNKLKVETKNKLQACQREKLLTASLTIEQVVEVKKLFNEGIRQCELVKLFGVSKSAIYRVCNGKSFSWIN